MTDPATVTSATPTVADVAQNVVDKLSTGMESLVHAFSKLAPHAWEVLVRQQIIEGVIGLVCCGVLLLAFIVSFCVTRKLYNKYKFFTYEIGNTENPTIALPSMIITVILGFILIFDTTSILNYVAHLINPEYYAAVILNNMIQK